MDLPYILIFWIGTPWEGILAPNLGCRGRIPSLGEGRREGRGGGKEGEGRGKVEMSSRRERDRKSNLGLWIWENKMWKD